MINTNIACSLKQSGDTSCYDTHPSSFLLSKRVLLLLCGLSALRGWISARVPNIQPVSDVAYSPSLFTDIKWQDKCGGWFRKRADAGISALVNGSLWGTTEGMDGEGWGGRWEPFLERDRSLWLWTHYRSNQKILWKEARRCHRNLRPALLIEQNFSFPPRHFLPPNHCRHHLPPPFPPSSEDDRQQDFTRPLQTGSITNWDWEEWDGSELVAAPVLKTWIIRRNKKGNLSYVVCFNCCSTLSCRVWVDTH